MAVIYFLKILGGILAFVSVLILAGISFVAPMLILVQSFDWGGIAAAAYCVLWFCFFLAVMITIDTWDER